ncbi:alpha/beta hydrolase [Streptomyces sp. NPDC056361]|uniref:alpha/beta hydrolase n=1 Tax=Streptomyces sp. NPDC056361 TaxID=3345795 RepID=UPI0035E11FD0
MATSRRIKALAACAVVLAATATTTATATATTAATATTNPTATTTPTTAALATSATRAPAITPATTATRATTTTPATTAADAPIGTHADPLARFRTQHVDWHACALGAGDEIGKALDVAGAACADITVPLDYANPDGRTLTVAVSRLKATDTAHRIGALLLNDGGPAGPSLHMPLAKAQVMGDVASRYDLIGMDPRFVGRSTPLDCGWGTGSALVRSAGGNRAAYRDEVALARELAARCERTQGDVLPYVTTRNTARDMDVIRGALGERALSYLGYSYGSYLGQVYTQLFPGRTDRMVLDGVNTAQHYSQTLLRGAEAANEAALRAWASWAAARHATYGLGATRGEVLATVRHILDAAAQEPLRIGTTYRLDEHVLPAFFVGGLGSDLDQRRADLAETVSVLARAADREPVEPSEALTGQMEFLLTGAGSAPSSQMTAIICGDVAERRGVGTYWRAVEKSRDHYPLAGPLANNITPCEFWDRPIEAPTVLTNDVPALLVNATGDPRTLYSGAQAVRKQWPSSRLLTVEGARQHGLYGEYGNGCVDDLVNAYLRTGRLPAQDHTCRG